MLSQAQENRYFERMKSSLGDKQFLIPHLNPGSVLDVGCGGGELAAVLQSEGFEVTGLDGSEAAIEASLAHNINVAHGYSHDVKTLFPADAFDNILCSAVLHEVYSYGDTTPGSAYTLASMENTLRQFLQALKTGGKLIIRDGVKPDNWNDTQVIKFTDPNGVPLVKKYLSMIPFQGDGQREVDLQIVDEFTVTGNASSVMEFLYTYTWGAEVFPRETQELYGVFTVGEYTDFLTQLGYQVVHSNSYRQEGYKEHLEDKARIFTPEGELVDFPHSQQVIVAVKTS